ncbi:hypothetical protein [Legionella micdadei]|uniref:Uncharacterized protein n=3 Tax=Legionella micdadei TaxID=451 RepID=A0A098GK48_LEGMI|nr:hypothetical protein [Legionella micdadei]KTD28984.1 hypothetical protein Lmic_0904 [Legionella micdadei]NSL17195.1 hypothetical protein [Legionella micdadei]CEG62367.1 protein of unknown function [Legionella micdadei]SCY02067.1 hypothetical protein SAMN02982997_00628 [Legionella micdadei]
MAVPLKALRISQLTKAEGQEITPSGHAVEGVQFTDIDGSVKKGFFKPLAADYPDLLAKYSVAVSVAIRLALGDRAAEDRLVFDETGQKIVGTVSIALPGYKPLLSKGSKSVPEDPQEKELVCPSKETLIKHNVAELLIAAWRYKCDDRHPDNFSLYGLIDWDMFLYHITRIMKGGRLIDGFLKPIPKKGMSLKDHELNTFPNVQNRTHWPANERPGNFNYYKHHLAAEAFKSLAGSTDFQEQMFEALLKELLTFDPEMLRVRLEEYLGDLTLDYSSLDFAKKTECEQEYPSIFNSETDKKLFIDHMVAVFQKEFGEFRAAVIYYQGCKDNGHGTAVSSFANFLRNKPSAFKRIYEWAEMQNQKMAEQWKKAEGKSLNTDSILDAYHVAPEGRYNLARMKKHYHKIWRDSHFLALSSCLEEAKLLANKLANELRAVPIPMTKKEQQSAVFDPSLAEAWMLLGEPEKMTESLQLDCHPENNLRRGLIVLEQFIEDLHRCCSAYYKIKLEELTSDKNNAFLEEMIKLIHGCEKELYSILGKEDLSVWARDFTTIADDLQRIYGGLNFQRHLFSKDQALGADAEHDYPALLKRKHTDEEVVTACLTALFEWANKLPEGQLDKYIQAIIEQEYQPSFYNFLSNRKRASLVLGFLSSSTRDSGADRLGTILSVGGLESNSLNTRLIANLIPQMLADTEQVDVNLLSVRTACNKEEFDNFYYAQKAREFVLNDPRFNHIHAKRNVILLQEAMYDWVAKLPREKFQAIVLSAVTTYEGPWYSYYLSNRARGETVRSYFDEKKYPNLSNERILAFIFAEGGITSSSLNPLLFKMILAAMKEDVKKTKTVSKAASSDWREPSSDVDRKRIEAKKAMQDLKYNIVMQAAVSEGPSPCPFLTSLEPYAKERTYTIATSVDCGSYSADTILQTHDGLEFKSLH